MKNLLFSLLAIVLINFNVNAQNPTKEEARQYAAKMLINFKNSLKNEYAASRNFDDFVRNATASHKVTTITAEGKALLEVTYKFYQQNTSNNTILATYSGKEVAAGFKFLKENPGSLDSQLFGFKASSTESNSEGYPCKWWQVRCHLVQVVGETAADAIIAALIVLLL